MAVFGADVFWFPRWLSFSAENAGILWRCVPLGHRVARVRRPLQLLLLVGSCKCKWRVGQRQGLTKQGAGFLRRFRRIAEKVVVDQGLYGWMGEEVFVVDNEAVVDIAVVREV